MKCVGMWTSAGNGPVLLFTDPPLLQLQPASFPGGPLSWVREPVHYLDLGGIQATSLRDFGELERMLAGSRVPASRQLGLGTGARLAAL